MQETTSKQLRFKFMARGKLVCSLGDNMRIVITEHMKDEYHQCGYDMRAYQKGNSKPIYSDFLGSFIEALECLDFFMWKAEEEYNKVVCVQTNERDYPADVDVKDKTKRRVSA